MECHEGFVAAKKSIYIYMIKYDTYIANRTRAIIGALTEATSFGSLLNQSHQKRVKTGKPLRPA